MQKKPLQTSAWSGFFCHGILQRRLSTGIVAGFFGGEQPPQGFCHGIL